jgi:hypothetical protein
MVLGEVELRFWVLAIVFDKVSCWELVNEVGAVKVLLLVLLPDKVEFKEVVFNEVVMEAKQCPELMLLLPLGLHITQCKGRFDA